jgi:hypothetical protein
MTAALLYLFQRKQQENKRGKRVAKTRRNKPITVQSAWKTEEKRLNR